MVEHGERFYCTFRYKAPMHLDLSLGWIADYEGLKDALFEKYPTLRHRKDLRICLDDAKPIKQLPTATVPCVSTLVSANNHHNNDKTRNRTSAVRTKRHASI